MSGKVIGVVVAGVDGTTLNFAIPVSHVAHFLARPDIQFTPPTLERSNVHQPVLFEARAVSLLPATSPIALELILRTEERQQRHAMKLVDGVYRVSAVPVPRPEGPLIVRLTARYHDATVEGIVEDRSFRVGGAKLQLAEVSRLRGGAKPQVVLHTGKTLEGTVTDLEAVPVRLGKQTSTLNLGRASDIVVEPAIEEPFVFYTIVAWQGGKEIGRIGGTLTIKGVARQGLGIRPPVLSQDKVVEPLPAPVADLAVGGGGRFLILHLPKLGKLAVFDVNKAKITHSIPADEDVKFAAGLDKLIVVSPAKHLVQRYSLGSYEQELSVSIPIRGVIKAVAMGSASNGPLLVHWAEGTQALDRAFCTLFDIQNMQALTLHGKGPLLGGHGLWFRDNMHFRSSPDGTVYGLWCTSHSPSGFQALLVTGDRARSPYEHTSVGHVVPGAGGPVLYTGAGMFTNDLQKLPGSWPEGYAFIPAQEGTYFLAVPGIFGSDMRRPNLPGAKLPDKVRIYRDQDDQPLAEMTNIEVPGSGDAGIKDDFTFDKRIHFVPAARLIITIPTSNDRLVLQRVDVEGALEKRALWVASKPPAVAKNGEMYRYQLEVRSKGGGLGYRLDYGPPGMTISKSGLLEWNVPARLGPANCAVQVTAQDAEGQKCEHRINFHVEGGGPLVAFKTGFPSFASVLFSDNGRVVCVTPQAISVWDVLTGKEVLNLQRPGYHLVAVSANGDRLAVSNAQEIQVWDLKTAKETIHLQGEQLGRGVATLALTSDGARLASIVNSKEFTEPFTVKVWDTASGKEVTTLVGEAPGGMSVLTFSPDGKRLAAGFGGRLMVWDVAKGEVIANSKVSHVPDAVKLLSFSPDSGRLALAALDNVVVLNATTGTELFLFKRKAPILHLAYSPDGKRLVCCWPSGVALHDAQTGKEIVAVTFGIAVGVPRPSFSPDGKLLALAVQTGPFLQTGKAWDPGSGQVRTFTAGGGYGSTLKLWHASTGREVLELTGHERIQSAHFVGADGKLLATQDADATWKVWQIAR